MMEDMGLFTYFGGWSFLDRDEDGLVALNLKVGVSDWEASILELEETWLWKCCLGGQGFISKSGGSTGGRKEVESL